MSDRIESVRSYDDLAAVDALGGREQHRIATLLSEGAAGVVWLPEWLASDKDLSPAHAAPQLFVGDVTVYSEKAYQVDQPDGATEYVPKSEAEAFRLAPGVERVETPQTGLTDFEARS